MDGAPAHNGKAHAPPAPVRQCLILADSAASVPVELLAGLSRRKMPVRVVADPASLMVELAHRGAAAVLIARGAWPHRVPQLLDAVARYHPHTGCWEYGDGPQGSARLVKLAPAVSAAGAAADTREPSPTPTPASQPRPNGASARKRMDPLVVHATHEPEATEPLISEEELTMLLGPLSQDDRP